MHESEFPAMLAASHVHTNYGVGGHDLRTPTTGLWSQGGCLTPAYALDIKDRDKTLNIGKPMTCRIVKIYVVDTDEAVPLDSRLLYQNGPFMTDSDDQELLYELDIKELLNKHNDKRSLIQKKNEKGDTVWLEPIRIRDLTMTVVTEASF